MAGLIRNRVARLLGPVLASQALWEELEGATAIEQALFERKIELDVPLLSFAMVVNRLISPKSKLSMTGWYPGVYLPRLLALSPEVHQFYRAMDSLLDCKESLERHLAGMVSHLRVKVSSIFMIVDNSSINNDNQ